jgi:hypothetical protein
MERAYRTLASLSNTLPLPLEKLIQKLNEVYYTRFDLNTTVPPWRAQLNLPEGKDHILIFEQDIYEGDLDRICELYDFSTFLRSKLKFCRYIGFEKTKVNPYSGKMVTFWPCKAEFNPSEVQEVMNSIQGASLPTTRFFSTMRESNELFPPHRFRVNPSAHSKTPK